MRASFVRLSRMSRSVRVHATGARVVPRLLHKSPPKDPPTSLPNIFALPELFTHSILVGGPWRLMKYMESFGFRE